jgi:AraC-like DNA-binding protein
LASSSPLEYSMVYIPFDELKRHATDMGLPQVEPALVALADPSLADRLVSFVGLAMRPDSDALAVQTEWCVLIAALISRYAGSDPREIPDDRQSLAMRRALAYLHDAWNQAIPLERLAQEAGMAPTYFCKQFAKSYGLAPHRYQTVLRIKRAKAMLTAGTAIADVATATGFADQSHLGRHLKACLGVTPGELNRLAPKARTF